MDATLETLELDQTRVVLQVVAVCPDTVQCPHELVTL